MLWTWSQLQYQPQAVASLLQDRCGGSKVTATCQGVERKRTRFFLVLLTVRFVPYVLTCTDRSVG